MYIHYIENDYSLSKFIYARICYKFKGSHDNIFLTNSQIPII